MPNERSHKAEKFIETSGLTFYLLCSLSVVLRCETQIHIHILHTTEDHSRAARYGMSSVLFVCLGNICRSPMAHGVLENLIREHSLQDLITKVDSCGSK